MSRPAYVHVELQAFQHNLGVVRKLAPNSKIMACAKANAYGHGIEKLVPGFNSADSVGVCCIEEALTLRDFGVMVPIVLMEGFFSHIELQAISSLGFETVVHHWQQVSALTEVTLTKPIKVWLKINTGMNRLGFNVKEVHDAWQNLIRLPNVDPKIRVMSHFANADDVSLLSTKAQIECFDNVTKDISAEQSLANSAAIIAMPQAHRDWVRPGIMLYGISPFANKNGDDFDLKPVMSLQSELIAIHELPKGEAIGYGSRYICPEDMRIGVVAMGYGDGYPRNAKSGTPALVNGKTVPLVGRVSMDMLTVDLRSQPEATIGDSVILWGEGIPVEVVAHHADTIAYELVCGINKRVHGV